MMKKTSNLNLSLYDPSDTFDITGSSNSLNNNMEIIDKKVGTFPNSDDLKSIKENLVLCQNVTPSSPDNKLWLDNSSEEVEIPDITDFNKLLGEINAIKAILKKNNLT